MGGVDVLAGSMQLGLNLRYWLDRDLRGWECRSGRDSKNGITGLQLVTGAEGKARVSLKAKGSKLPMPVR